MRTLYLLIILLALQTLSQANDVEFIASAPSEVAQGQRFRITFQLNKRPQGFDAPDFAGFRRVSGPSQSSSTSMQVINGQTTLTESVSYTYTLEASQQGAFTIAPARVTIDDEVYESNAVTITVTESTAATPDPQPPTPPPGEQKASTKDLFIRATASNSNPYQGEQVIVSYNIYTRVSVNQYSIDRLPSYRGFWSENITAQGQPQTRTEVIDGQTYRVAEIYRVALFPQRSGEIDISPLEAEVTVRTRGQRRQSIFDEFFGGAGRTIQQTVESNKLTLDVAPLPVQNRPSNFSGMVGTDFDITASVNQTQLNPNEAANLHVIIEGKGNMRMLEKPEFSFPTNLEVFDPNISDNIRNTVNGVRGSRTFDFVMIPRTAGSFMIPSYEFVYFDPQRGRYISKPTPEFTIEVEGDVTADAARAASQEDIKLIGTDIRHIYTGHIQLLDKGVVFYRSRNFWILLSIPFVIFVFFLIYWRSYIKLQSDQQLLRNKKAQKLARKRLKKARALLEKKQEDVFYDEIFRALWGYLSDKLSIPVSILNKENVAGAFKAKKVSQELSDNFIQTLNDCEFARFAPGEKENRMSEIYQKAFETIITIEKELRNK